jgi:hypothetical protein
LRNIRSLNTTLLKRTTKGTGERMNEKIKQLALDAGIGFTLWDDSGREMIDNYTPEEYLEKFAELIVKECASKVDNILREKRDGGGTMGDEIRKHFGVEE